MDAIERNGERIPPSAPARMLKSGTIPVLRAIRLLWGRMGAARFYVLGTASVIILLAAVGLFHLAKSGQTARAKAASNVSQNPLAAAGQGEFSQTMPLPAANDPISDHPLIAITEVAPKKRFGRHGAARVDVKIGVTPRPNARKGQVEIRVFFYDVTRDREIRPTQAQVAYQWLTPVRDWTDPTPKYLVATYLHPREARRSSEKLRYGGFIVRIYFDGQLQDERAEPEGLLAALRSGVQPRSAPGATPAESPAVAAAAAPSPTLAETPVVKTEVASNAITPAPTTPTILPEKRSIEEVAALPYAHPVPGKPGFVYSPFDKKFLIDVRGAPPGTVVNDPHAGKAFRVP